MGKLWIFGDSFSEPFDKVSYKNIQSHKPNWKTNYNEWKGYIPNYYADFIAKEFNLIVTNNALGGSDNYTIFDSLIRNLHLINDDDVIIIGWSSTLRFRFATTHNAFLTIRPGNLEHTLKINRREKFIDLSDNTLIEVGTNRDNSIYINELNNYIQLLNFAFKYNKIIHWSPFLEESKGLNTSISLMDTDYKIERIRQETNGLIDDGHFSESTHEVVGKKIINAINDYDLNKSNILLKTLI
jgi:hypothetical protein